MNMFTLSKPQRRQRVFTKDGPPFPVPVESQTGTTSGGYWWYYTAYIVNGRILVQHTGDMEQLYKLGFFGKGTLSRHRPQFERYDPVIHRSDPETGKRRRLKVTSLRHYLRHCAWSRACDESALDVDHHLPRRKKATSSRRDASPSFPSRNDDEQPPMKQHRVVETSQKVDAGEENVDFDKSKSGKDSRGTHPQVYDSWNQKEHPGSSETGLQMIQDEKDPWATPTGGGGMENDPWAETTEEEAAAAWDIGEVAKKDDSQYVVEDSSVAKSSMDDDDASEQVKLEQEDAAETDEPISENLLDSVIDLKPSDAQCDSNSVLDNKMDNYPEADTCGDVELTSTTREHLDPRCLSEDKDADWIVRDDTDDSDIDDAMDTRLRWQPAAKKNPYVIKESLQLSMEEAFFLSYALGCLVIYDENKVALDLSSMWKRFCEKDTNFLFRYAVYHNLRSKGWVPKSGLKYGSDFLVYKQGPAFYHSSYSVLVQQVSEKDLQPQQDRMSRAKTWTELAAINRMTEQVSKEVMFCYVIEPSDLTTEDKTSPKCLGRLKIQEVILRRWVSKQERENMEYYLIP